jgi:DNA-binding IclR family transcriptional regulator
MGQKSKITQPDGSQSIARAVELLAHVAARSETGARLSEVANASGLHIATTRRIMQALVTQGLLAFDSKTKIYSVGPAIFSFAVQGNPWFSRQELFMPVLERIAKRTHDTVLFSIRSGDEAICLARREGAFPIRVMSLEKGSRRPLGAGSGSLAILAFLPERERGEILLRCAPLYEPFGLAVSILSEAAAEARRLGFAFNPGRIIEGVYGIGVPLLAHGHAVASVSVAAIESRMTPSRRVEIIGIICEEVSPISGFDVPQELEASTRSLRHGVA